MFSETLCIWSPSCRYLLSPKIQNDGAENFFVSHALTLRWASGTQKWDLKLSKADCRHAREIEESALERKKTPSAKKKKKKFWNLQIYFMWFEHSCMSTVTMIAAHDSPTSILGILCQAGETLLLKATKKLCPTWLKACHFSMCPQAAFTGPKKQKECWASETWWGVILLFYQHYFYDWIAVIIFSFVQMLSVLSVP